MTHCRLWNNPEWQEYPEVGLDPIVTLQTAVSLFIFIGSFFLIFISN